MAHSHSRVLIERLPPPPPPQPRARITATANQLHIKSGLQVVRTRQDAKKTEKKCERQEKKAHKSESATDRTPIA